MPDCQVSVVYRGSGMAGLDFINLEIEEAHYEQANIAAATPVADEYKLFQPPYWATCRYIT
ncbi:hypothetical protein GCM10027098_38500 [Bowmanella dokdonensis]